MLFNRCILPLYQTFACMHACMHNPVLHLDPSEKILQIVAWNSAYKVAVYRTCPYSTRVLLSFTGTPLQKSSEHGFWEKAKFHCSQCICPWIRMCGGYFHMQLSLCLLDFQSEWSSCEEISFLCLFHALNTFALSCIFFTYKHVRSALSLMNTIAVHVLKVPNCHNDVSFYTFNFLRPYLYVAILSYVFSSCLSFSVMLV